MKIVSVMYPILLSEKTKKKSEKIIVTIAIISFFLHLLFVFFNKLHWIILTKHIYLLENPIAAIYTPFSFILIYEVYLLIYYLPQSTSTYIGKQYEIITLILIRRVFKDMSNLKFTKDWFSNPNDILFMFDLIAVIILFFLIYIFYKINRNNITTTSNKIPEENTKETNKFIQIKKNIASFLVPLFFVLSIYSLLKWIYESFFSIPELVLEIKDVNKIFFDDFFTILILVDVFLLLFSFLHSDKFHKVIRNSAFIISTIMIKLSFSAEGILNTILVVGSVLFGITILAIHNNYENKLAKKPE